ncbi:MAG: dihydroneopterin aldolase [Burkholderiaceae bacterium]
MPRYDDEQDNEGLDRIVIERLRLPARLGILDHERLREQTVCVNLEFGLPSTSCFESDDIEDTINYAVVADRLRALATCRHYNLVEYLAEQMANLVLEEFGASWVKLQCRKIRVVPECRYVGVSITRYRQASLSYPARALAQTEASLHPGSC